MKSPSLSRVTKKYFDQKKRKKMHSLIKEGKMRFDLAEGLWAKEKDAMLPDKNCSSLKDALSSFLHIDCKNICIFSGIDRIIDNIPRIYLNPEDVAVVVVPTFERLLTTNSKLGVKIVPYRLNVKNGFVLDQQVADEIITLSKKSKAKLLWIASPNNPTGVVVQLPVLEKIIRSLPNTVIVIDEAYREFSSFDPNNSAITFVDKNPNVLVLRTFSKAFGIAGARIGYVAAHKDTIYYFENYRTLYNVSTYAQEKAEAVLSSKRLADTKTLINKIRIERERVLKQISQLPGFEFVPNSETNFFLLRHKRMDLFEKGYQNGIMFSDWRNAEGIKNKGFVRVSVNTPRYNSKLISMFKKINNSIN